MLIATFSLELQIGDKTIVETCEKRFNRTLPAFTGFNTFEDYINAANNTNLFVKGYVTGIISKTINDGNSNTCIYVNDMSGNGGYYVYGLKEDPVGQVEIGDVVVVNGNKDLYNGTHELKEATVEKTSDPAVSVVARDFTEVYANATSLSDAALNAPQAQLVKICGVTITSQGDNGYYHFKLGELESYLRISSSTNGLTKAETEAFKTLHTESYGMLADVEGVISVYSGNFYLAPVSANAISNVREPERSDAEKVAFELEGLKVVESLSSDTVVTLATTGTLYDTVTISWSTESDAVVIDNAAGTATFTLPESKTTVTLTATLTLNGETATKSFDVVLNKVSTAIKELNVIGAAQEHSTYTADKYIAEGVVVEIANAQYGNIYIMDGNGDKLYIYGLYDGNGKKYSEMESKPVVGDYVKVVGPMGQYNGTAQMKNADIVSFTTPTALADIAALPADNLPEGKFFAKVTITEVYKEQYGNMYVTDENGELKVTVYGSYDPRGVGYADMEVKPVAGDVLYIYGALSTYNGAVQFKNATIIAFEKGSASIEEPAVIENVTVSYLLEVETALEMKQAYTVTGTVSAWKDANSTDGSQYGNFYLSDGTNQIYVYGATASASALVWGQASGKYGYTNPKDFLTNDLTKEISIGDTVTLKVVRTSYNGTVQLNAIVLSVEKEEVCAHANTTTATDNSTCLVKGSVTVTCNDCGAEVSKTELDLADHTWNEGVVTPPTCDADGYTTYTCTVENCGQTKTEAGDAKTGHDFSEGIDCANGCGTKSHTCDFSVKGETVAPTCTEDGYTVYSCDFEGCSATQQGDLVDALGHDDSGAAATCTTAQVCARTGCGVELAPATGHDDSGAAATCTTAQVCATEGCNEVLVAALGHKYGAWTPAENDTHVSVCANDASHKETKATGELLAELYSLAKSTNYDREVKLTGVITIINSAYSEQYSNVDVTIRVGDHADYPMLCYHMAGDGADVITKGDTITVTGTITNYNGTIEYANKTCKLVSYDPHTCKEVLLQDPTGHWSACELCDKQFGEKVAHDFSNGACECGRANLKNVSKTHTELASIAGVTPSSGNNATGVVNGTNIALDDNITIRADKAKSSTAPNIYTESLRLYQNGATLTITAKNNAKMKTIVITLATKSGGQGPIAVTGGTASELENLKYTITVNEGVSEVVITTTGTSSSTRLYVEGISVDYE